eukprot:scaffold11311_cov112-Skeletonema_dohrnii-CCMP3373.AAC.3
MQSKRRDNDVPPTVCRLLRLWVPQAKNSRAQKYDNTRRQNIASEGWFMIGMRFYVVETNHSLL